MMDTLGKYPADPQTRFLGENNTRQPARARRVGTVGWRSSKFRDHNGQESEELLGRDQAHWSFFMDSDASVMEGNDIEDLGGGAFRTTATVQRYSSLDQYAMGYVSESQVPAFFYVENPSNVVPSREREDAPRTGVTFNGTKAHGAHPGRRRGDGIPRAVARPDVADPPAGVHLRALERPHARSRAGRQESTGFVANGERSSAEPSSGRARIESRLRPPT